MFSLKNMVVDHVRENSGERKRKEISASREHLTRSVSISLGQFQFIFATFGILNYKINIYEITKDIK